MSIGLSRTALSVFFVAVYAGNVPAQSPYEYSQCPQITLSETLTIDSQGPLDPDLQIRDDKGGIIASLEIDRDILFRIAGLELLDKDARPIANYRHRVLRKPVFNICTQTQIARIESKDTTSFSVFAFDGKTMYRVVMDTDSAPNRFRVYASNVLVAEGSKTTDYFYKVIIPKPEMRKDDLLPLIFGLTVYYMSDFELAEDLRSIDDLVW